MPQTAFAAGTDTGEAIQLGTGGISGYSDTNSYDYIYYGIWNSSPIKWRVLDDKTNTGEKGLFLLTDELLGTGGSGDVYFDNTSNPSSNAWQGSDAQNWCKTFYSNNLTAQEQSAVLATNKSDSEYTSSTYQIQFAASKNILNGDKVFFLSAEEAETGGYGFESDGDRVANYGNSNGLWWLRSPYSNYTNVAGIVDDYGEVSTFYVYLAWAVRPASNVNLNSVLFTSAAVGGKTDSTVDSNLTEVAAYDGNELKLTLLDSSRSFTASTNTSTIGTGESLSITYFGAKTGGNEYVSAMIVDISGSVLYYGWVARDSANGTASITIPSGLTPGSYTLKVFSEQNNGDRMTDYAGQFVDIPLTVNADTTAPTLTAGDATRTGLVHHYIRCTSLFTKLFNSVVILLIEIKQALQP